MQGRYAYRASWGRFRLSVWKKGIALLCPPYLVLLVQLLEQLRLQLLVDLSYGVVNLTQCHGLLLHTILHRHTLTAQRVPRIGLGISARLRCKLAQAAQTTAPYILVPLSTQASNPNLGKPNVKVTSNCG